MVKILICFSLVFGPSMQAFAQGGSTQPKKDGARLADPRTEWDKKDLAIKQREANQAIDYTEDELENLKLSAEQTQEVKEQVDILQAQLAKQKAALDAIENDLKQLSKPAVSCFDVFAIRSTFELPDHGASDQSILGGLLVGLSAGILSQSLPVGLVSTVVGVPAFLLMFAPKWDRKASRSYKLATRFDLSSHGVDTTLSKEDLSWRKMFKSRILKHYNRQLPKGIKDATIDDVRAVMVEGFNSGNFCHANAPKSDEAALMTKKQMNRYIVAKLAERLGSAPSNATGSATGSQGNSAGGVQTAE